MIESRFDLPGYQISEIIYNSVRTLVYRGLREVDQLPVAIKLLKSSYPSLIELARFKNEYAIAKMLDVDGVIRVYSLENWQNRFALIMEEFSGISLLEYYGLTKPGLIDLKSEERLSKPNVKVLTEFLQIAIKIADILYNLYENNIIHKDIKPANILINPTTKQVKLIDFSIASVLPRVTQMATSPNILEGTLAYLSPEQTGRMNRGVDYRTDFYSLGVTFYHLLAGQLPFQSNDMMELVHCHIAKQPDALHRLNPAIPPQISAIINKLMAKNAENRYQSALGLKHDLEICLEQWQKNANIVPFEIGQEDVCHRFAIPEKLYGRQAEVAILLAAFDRVSQGATELMLVLGFSGVGKTVVINEVHKPITCQRGYFIRGKFDQFNRNIPFSALVQAFRDLMAQLLTESDDRIEVWRNKILLALGENAQVIIEVIPELEYIIGKQPCLPEVTGNAAQNRFNLLFQKFIQVFATQEHPLVIFLDDLQWADSASLKLIYLLMSETSNHYLLVIGAYRNNEVSIDHPMIITIEEMRQEGITVNKIVLDALAQTDIHQMVADTLKKLSPEQVSALTHLVYRKTKGNPFFASQFLKSLYEDKLITFDTKLSRWYCDIEQIEALSFTGNVLEFVVLQIQKLLPQTQDVLKLAACIGNQFNLERLSVIYEKSPAETVAHLWPAIKDGFILPIEEGYNFFQNEFGVIEYLASDNSRSTAVTYKFLHDRFQQGAYSLISENEKPATHLKIGQLLLSNTLEPEREKIIFEIVNQLNIGIKLVTSESERDELAQLNLLAGKKAKSSTAYQGAIEYFITGISLLKSDCWQSQYELSLALYESAADAAYLGGDYEQMEQLAQTVIHHTKNILDRISIYETKIQAYVAQNHVLDAIEIARRVMSQFNLVFPRNPTTDDIQQALQETATTISGREIAQLLDLPDMVDADKRAVIRIVAVVTPAVYIAEPNLFPLLILSQVNASIQYGNAPFSAFCYACYGILLNGIVHDIEAADQIGNLALLLTDKFNINEIKPTVFYVVGAFIAYLKSPLQKSLQLMLEGYKIALETGNLYYVGFNTKDICQYSYFLGQNLTSLEQDMRAYIDVLKNCNQGVTLSYCRIFWQAVLNLLGKSDNPCALNGEALNESKFLPQLVIANELTGLHYFFLHKMILCYLFENIYQAVEIAAQAREYLVAGTGYATIPMFYFYDSLIALAEYSIATVSYREKLWQRVKENQVKMETWAHYAPMNYLHKLDLVKAEQFRVLGQMAQAVDLYDLAIAGAKENKYIQEEALANELAARFYQEWNKEPIAQIYLRNACYAYQEWGAVAKINDLQSQYPQLFSTMLFQQREHASDNNDVTRLELSSSSGDEALDLVTVIKASHALAEEIELDKLLTTLMQVVSENAGAEKSMLLLLQDNNWVIAAQRTSKVTVEIDMTNPILLSEEVSDEYVEMMNLPSLPLSDSQDIPKTVVNYVSRTNETLVLDDASIEVTFAKDPYIALSQPKSLLCTPIHYRGKLIGILYLENSLTTGVFTQKRLEVLRLLTAQAAISLQNAMLYTNLAAAKEKLESYSHTLENKVQQRTQELNEKNQHLSETLDELKHTQSHLIETEKMSSLGQLVAGIAHEINNPVNFIFGNLTHISEYTQDLRRLVELYQKHYPSSHPEIEAEILSIELEFLLQDLPQILSSMRTGADRIRQIVASLRNFSRMDESEIKAVNIHEGLDSALLILSHRLEKTSHRPAIKVVKKYAQIPEVNCYASQINQVFMNVLSNAIDALDSLFITNERATKFEHKQTEFPTIQICTKITNRNTITIQVIDNGSGMSEDIKRRIFEPFFTTKPIGSGTGLGLSISYSIIKKHHGKISVTSELGKGAKFSISIPLHSFSYT